ncbi:amidohydrolase [Nocardioides sp. CFH 31398]|uniref:amidohydrolase n=1 Tax=Nocardioides sp. CFH 31398 TaxID=2919579 RepID=UPI001F0683C0|nr:amidohydrolase family protein [Nocardioides sp. CFH 31398]MCH1866875.1 amidohydrolase family protein [Nocardioides sp. CFH 31398]
MSLEPPDHAAEPAAEHADDRGDAAGSPRRLLLRDVRLPGRDETVVAVEDGVIVAITDAGSAAAHDGAGASLEVVDARGALLTAGFTDAHVHTVRTGFALLGLDLTGVPSLTAVLDRVAAHAAAHPDAGVLLGQGWDETGWSTPRPPTAEELERAAPGRRVQLTRVDGHSAVLSPALASLVPGLADLEGWSDDGRVERDAHHAARAALELMITDADRLDAARAACRAMAAVGLLGFHENAAPHIGPEAEIPLVRQAAAETGLRATVYWGELLAVGTARRLGVEGLAGDLVADGALGSRTAALGETYADAGSCGHAYLDAVQVADHVVACTEAGLQAGFHAIGDAALDAVGEGLSAAARRLGPDGSARLRAARHRVEHVEMPSSAVVAVLDELGVTASVQPLFDALWGGPDGMYATRLGPRWERTNPFADLAATSGGLALGSDAPVTPVGPWQARPCRRPPPRPAAPCRADDGLPGAHRGLGARRARRRRRPARGRRPRRPDPVGLPRRADGRAPATPRRPGRAAPAAPLLGGGEGRSHRSLDQRRHPGVSGGDTPSPSELHDSSSAEGVPR